MQEPLRVIKLGGSLLKSGYLRDCLARIEQAYQGSRLVIVPGGGVFADQVRMVQQDWHFDDSTAHEMALLAMQQMALLFKSVQPSFVIADTVSAILKPSVLNKVVIWSPCINELNQSGVPASWDISSDSLAVWLAAQLSADELILVKSVEIDPLLSVAQLSERHIVDKAFSASVAAHWFPISIIHARQM